MKNLKTLFLIAAIAVLFNSCAKDGAPGATGPAGTNGNANVSEQTFSITSSNWNGDGHGGWWCVLVNPTNEMNLSGGVETYVLDVTNNDWNTLPWQGGNLSITTELQISGDAVWVYFDDSDGSTAINNPGSFTFKVITIPTP